MSRVVVPLILCGHFHEKVFIQTVVDNGSRHSILKTPADLLPELRIPEGIWQLTVFVCVRACVRACERACVRACVCVCFVTLVLSVDILIVLTFSN